MGFVQAFKALPISKFVGEASKGIGSSVEQLEKSLGYIGKRGNIHIERLGEFTNFYRESNGVVKLLKRKAIYKGESIAKHTFKEKLDKFFNPKTNKTYSVSDVRIFKPSGELTRRTRNISVGDTKWSPTPKKPDSRSLEILDYSTGSYSRNITGSETLGSVRQVGQLLPSGQIQLTNSMFTKPAMTFQRVFS